DRARGHGARIVADAPVASVVTKGGAAAGVVLADGHEIAADVVVAACDPFTLSALVDLPAALVDRLTDVRRPGTTLKVNLALAGLPRFSCLPQGSPSPFGSTIHLLEQDTPLQSVRGMWADVQAGR